MSSKRLRKAYEGLEGSYNLDQAILELKKRSTTQFDETIEIAMNLNIDPRKSDQGVRGFVQLPGGTGKVLRVGVFAKGAKAKEALDAGADVVGDEDLAQDIQSGKIHFDRCIATPDLMGLVGKLGKILGPKGIMPNPKLGTVTLDVAAAVAAAKGGQVEFRAEKSGIVHAGIGKASFSVEVLIQNFHSFVNAVIKARPLSAKGVYVKRVHVSSTMGPAISLDLSGILRVKG